MAEYSCLQSLAAAALDPAASTVSQRDNRGGVGGLLEVEPNAVAGPLVQRYKQLKNVA